MTVAAGMLKTSPVEIGYDAGRPCRLHRGLLKAWVANWNENPTPFVWHKTAEQILERIAGYCAAVNEATGA